MPIPPLDDPEVYALAIRTALPPQQARLLLLVARASDPKMRAAIGGAIAVRDAGWRRHTDDVDIFATPVSTRRLVKRLARLGLETFWITDAHAVAYAPEDNEAELAAGEPPSIRIDVLSTVTEPEASAIRTAIPAQRLGVPLKVFRPDHLAAIKFLAGRGKDLLDFDELVLLGIDLERVKYIVATTEPDRAAAMMARARRTKKNPDGVREPQTRYLSTRALNAAWAAKVGPRA